MNNTNTDTKLLVTVLLLIFVYPIGVLVMWFWSGWRIWLKVIVSFPIILALLGLLSVIILAGINPRAQIDRANLASKAYLTPAQTKFVYPNDFKIDYMNSCVSKEASYKYCVCTLNYLENNVNLEELQNQGEKNDYTSSPAILNAASFCKVSN